MYYVSVDPSGRLGWKSSTLTYSDTKAHVLEVLTEKAGMCDEVSVVIAAACGCAIGYAR